MRTVFVSLILAVSCIAQMPSFEFPRIGGVVNATPFGTWAAVTQTPVESPGVAVFVLARNVTVPGAGQISPATRGVPVQVIDGPASEVITPSNVACQAGQCVVTAAFSHAHPGGFLIRSANNGLNEAIQEAAAGGGTVVVGGDWHGTTPEITQAAGSAKVMIDDERGGTRTLYIWDGTSYVAGLALGDNGALTTRAPAITPTSIEGTQYSDQFAYPPQFPGAALIAATLDTVTPIWASLPAGLASGAISIVNESSSSATITRISGDYFNPGWGAGKSVSLDGDRLTIVSCANSTMCTLSGNAPRSSSYGWLVVGNPTPVFLSGGAGTAESVDVLGIGAECSGGSALSLCFIPSGPHSGAWSLESATAGVQEAVNAVAAAGNGGRVVIPPGALTWYAPVVIASADITLAGSNQYSPHISVPVTMPAYSGAADGLITELNTGNNTLQNMWISGPSAGGGYFDVAWYCTTGTGGCGHDVMQRMETDGAGGSAIDSTGQSRNAAGIVLNGIDGIALRSVYAIYDNDGLQVAYYAGGSRTDISGCDFSFDTIGTEEVTSSLTGFSIVGSAFFDNSGAGLALWGPNGIAVVGNHFEQDSPDIAISHGGAGVNVSGNEISQTGTAAAACWICDTDSSNVYGITIQANDFNINSVGPPIAETALVAVTATGAEIADNSVSTDATAAITLSDGIALGVGSSNNRIGALSLTPGAQQYLTLLAPVADASTGYNGASPYSSAPTFTIAGTLNATQLLQAGSAVALSSQLPLRVTTGTVTPGSIAAGSCYTSTAVAVVGATTSMVVVASPAAPLGSGLTWSAWVSGPGYVEFTVCNATASALTPAATAWNIRVTP